MQSLIGKKESFSEGINVLLELREELFGQITSIVNTYPKEVFYLMPFAGAKGYHSKTLGYSLWHIFRIEDIVAHDIAVRWGGEEFILFMPGIDVKEAEGRLEYMLEKIRVCEVRFEDKTVTFTATIGLASCDDPLKYEQVINEADC